jgi:PAS domain S-box-containing protein
MAQSLPNPIQTPPARGGAASRLDDRNAALRLRLAMYLAFAVIALAVILQAALSLRLEAAHASDAELLDRAGEQRKMAQHFGRVAALISAGAAGQPQVPVQQAQILADLLSGHADRALHFEGVLREQGQLKGGASAGVAAALEGYQAARERLWYRGQSLVMQLSSGTPDPQRLTAAHEALQAQVDPAADAAQLVLAQLRLAAEARVLQLRHEMLSGVATLVALLVLLSLVVVEPTARAVTRQAQQRLQEAAHLERLALVAEHTTAMVLITDADNRIQWANAALTRLTGWQPEDLLGRLPREVLHAGHADPAVLDEVQQARKSGLGIRREWLHRRRDGSDLWLDVDLCPLFGEDAQLCGFVSVASDVTERRALQLRLGQSARIDHLTQLANRAALMERLQQAIDHAARHPGYGFAALFLDFDRFKQVNDTLGHAAGDELLRQVARRLRQALRPGDVLARLAQRDETAGDVAARIGGDEFVVVLEGVNDEATLAQLATRLLNELSEPYLINNAPLQSGLSIGVVLHGGARAGAAAHGAPATAERLLRNADTAMYEAKRAGRGRWVLFNDSMQERVARAQAVEQELRRALKADELYVVYQPALDLETRRLVGVEALVRWRHPERGPVLPADFVGVAEESGLIDALGTVVLRKACQQFVRWRAAFGAQAPAQLAVNLSRAQLQRAGMVDELALLLRECAMQPEWLQLEVTENVAAQDEVVRQTLRSLKNLGVRLALDDFGTGFSSLASLHQLPVDTVKIDRSFVSHAQSVEYHRVLIEATIRVARTLGMATVAEGIETEAQAALMLNLQCDHGQGFLFSHPLEAPALERWLQREATALV